MSDKRLYFCNATKTHVQKLGYHSCNVAAIMSDAKAFAEKVGVPIESVTINEIKRSRSYQGMYYLHSPVIGEQAEGAWCVDNAIELLHA